MSKTLMGGGGVAVLLAVRLNTALQKIQTKHLGPGKTKHSELAELFPLPLFCLFFPQSIWRWSNANWTWAKRAGLSEQHHKHKSKSLDLKGLCALARFLCVCQCVYSCVFLPHSHLAMCYSMPGKAFPTDPFVLNSSAVVPLCQVVCLLQLCKMCVRASVCMCVCVRACMRESELN